MNFLTCRFTTTMGTKVAIWKREIDQTLFGSCHLDLMCTPVCKFETTVEVISGNYIEVCVRIVFLFQGRGLHLYGRGLHLYGRDVDFYRRAPDFCGRTVGFYGRPLDFYGRALNLYSSARFLRNTTSFIQNKCHFLRKKRVPNGPPYESH